jgi:competence protein ComEC
MKHLPSFSWSLQPFSRLAIFFASGCLLSKLIVFSIQNIIILSCIWIFLFAFFIFLYFQTTVTLKKSIFVIRGLLIWALFFLAGLSNGIISHPVFPCQLDSLIGKNHVLIIQIDSEPRIKSGNLSIDCKILNILSNDKLYSLDSKIRVQIKDGDANAFQFAQRKLILGKLFYPNCAIKPGDFNYASFLKSKGISSIIRVDSSHILNFTDDEFSFQRLSFKWRSSILDRFHDDVIKADEKQVASALLLGDRSEMNTELLKEYSSGGIIHILAVSGLHVGLIYQLCIWFFKYFKFLKKKRIDMLLIITILWVYASMTGLSPSVNRAVCMFTLLSFSDFLNRKVSPFNILSSAAFILLLIKPDAIFDMGFQLSFAAVWGILSARPILDRLKTIDRKFASFILTPIIISIVAQIATAPFSLYAFGTFPTWFLPANLIAVPLSTILTYLGIAALMFSNIPILGNGLMILFSFGIRTLNNWAQFISSLPYSQLSNLNISFFELICYSVSVYILFNLFKKRSSKNYTFFLCSLFLGVSSGYFTSNASIKTFGSLVFSYNNTFHFHAYFNSIDHHYVLFPTDLQKFPIPEFEKLISPAYIGNKQVMFHPVCVRKNQNTTHRSLLFLNGHKLLQEVTIAPFKVISHKPIVIVLNTNDETIKYLELNKMNIRCIIPVPWLYAKHKIRLKKFASKCSIEFYDPEISGWRNFLFDND